MSRSARHPGGTFSHARSNARGASHQTVTMAKVDEGHAALTTLSRTYGQLVLSNANEAETRLKVIDEVIFSVLGWQKEDVNVEERVSEDGHTKFADYIIRTASTAILIEAKRAAATFTLPHRHVRMRLGGALSGGAVGEAIRQARDYCRSKSIPFAVVTNGSAWIVFPAARADQVPFEDSEARIFRDLDDLTRRFVEFWELLSRERTLDGNLGHELLGRSAREDLVPLTVRQVLPEPGYRLGRNALYDHIEPAISAALTDEALLEDPEALEKCYVKTSERLKYDARLQIHLRDRLPPLGHTTTRIKSRPHESKPRRQISGATPHSPRKFIVLLGAVGAGKTTFLHYTRKVSAAAAINGKVLWFIIDFKKATQADRPRHFILRELLAEIESDRHFDLGDWRKSISPAYSDRIAALRRGPLYLLAKSDPDAFDRAIAQEITSERDAVDPYVETILRWASRKWPGFLIIDNVDQIDSLAQQDSIFTEAHALARRVNFNVIMSLRESTFLKHRERPVFDAFEFESFYVDPPNVIPVLARRCTFARKILEGRRIELHTEQGMRVQVPDLSVFFDIVSSSLLDDGGTGLLIEALAGGNVRRGLALVREFLASGHTNADHAIATYLSDGGFRFPRHEFFRGAVLGPFRYFNDGTSLLPNLFDSKLATPTLQLLRLQVVALLVDRAAKGVTEGVHVSDLVAACARIGVPERDFLELMQDLGRRGMCRSVDGLPVAADSAVVPTRLAAYAIREMCVDFTYVDFCSIDAAIHDGETLSGLQELTVEIESAHSATERVKLRGSRVERFLEYLVRCEERWIVEARRRALGGEWQRPLVKSEVRQRAIKSAAAALKSAKRVYGPGTPSKGAKPDGNTVTVDPRTYTGGIVDAWREKDYVFIRGDDGTDWFSHRRDFVTAEDWERRQRGAKCVFLRGTWNGKPRATSVRLQ